MSQTIYRKYRPKKFSDIVGQQHIIKTLINSIKKNRVSHAYLFTGSRGTGKTTMARIFSAAINCQNNKKGEPCLKCDSCKEIITGRSIDIIEIDAASHTGVDNIREIKEGVNLPPTLSKFKVYIIDEAHMLSQGAFNALLKTLEEPPAHVVFILATTEVHKIPDTILSRCQKFDFTKFSIENIIHKLSAIAKSEKIKISDESLELIALSAEGGMRDAESLLGQIISLEDKNITVKEVEEILGLSSQKSVEDAIEFIIKKDIASIFGLLNTLSKEGTDLEVFTKALLNYLRKLLMATSSKNFEDISSILEATSEQKEKIKQFSTQISTLELVRIIDNLLEAKGKIRSSFIPQLPLEIAFVKSIENFHPQINPVSRIISSPQQFQKPIQNTPQQLTSKPTTIIPPKKVEADLNTTEKAPTQPSQNTIAPEKPITPSIEPEIPEKNTSSSVPVSLDDVLNIWQTALGQIKINNKTLASFLTSCRPISVENNLITLSAKFPFHKDKIEEMQNRLTIENFLDNILKSAVRISVQVEERNDGPDESYFASLDPEAGNGQSENNLVSDALSMFGGKIIE